LVVHPQPLTIIADTQNEAIAFFAAAVQTKLANDARTNIFARAIIVRDLAAWDPLGVDGMLL
jgi:hypothetical protein